MGSAASSAVGPSGYSLDDLLAHRSATGDLTAQALCDLARTHFDVAWSPEDLAKHRVVQGKAAPAPGDAVVIDGDGFRDYVGKACVRKGNAVSFPEKPGDIYSLISPLEARQGFPRALAALKANPKLAAQPMRGHGAGSSWLPLHCVLLLGPKFQGWWWPLAEPLVGALLQAHPRAAQQRVLEGVPFPFGHLPLELAVTRGWDARVVAKVHGAYRAAASTLDPIRLPKAALSKAAKAEKKTAGKGAKPPPASSAPEIALHEIKGGGTVATLAAAGWKKEDAPESIRGLR